MREVARTVDGSVLLKAETIAEIDETLAAAGGSFRYVSGVELYAVRNAAGETCGFVAVGPKGGVEKRLVDGYADSHLDIAISSLKRATGEGRRLGVNETQRFISRWERYTRSMSSAFSRRQDAARLEDIFLAPQLRRCVKLPDETWRDELAATIRKRMTNKPAEAKESVWIGFALATGRHMEMAAQELTTAKSLMEIALARNSFFYDPEDFGIAFANIALALADHEQRDDCRNEGAESDEFVEFVHLAPRPDRNGASVLVHGLAPLEHANPAEVETWGTLRMHSGTELVVRRIGEDFFRPLLDPTSFSPITVADFSIQAKNGFPWRDNPFADRPSAKTVCARMEIEGSPCESTEVNAPWVMAASEARIVSAGRLVEIDGIVHKRCPEPQVEPVTIVVATRTRGGLAQTSPDSMAVGWRLGELSQYDDMRIYPDQTRSVSFGPSQFSKTAYAALNENQSYSWDRGHEALFRVGFDGIDRLKRMVARLAVFSDSYDDTMIEGGHEGGMEDVGTLTGAVRRMMEDELIQWAIGTTSVAIDASSLSEVDFPSIHQIVIEECPLRFIEDGTLPRRRLVQAVVAYAESAAWKMAQPSVDEDLSPLYSM